MNKFDHNREKFYHVFNTKREMDAVNPEIIYPYAFFAGY
jgi:hypothetical protein